MKRRCFLCALVSLMATRVFGRDLTGKWAQADPSLKEWFNYLASKGGQNCCSSADGYRIDDADWEEQDRPGFPYRVRIEGAWRAVPEDAVVDGQNRVGYAMVWPVFVGTQRTVVIRCFIPGTEG